MIYAMFVIYRSIPGLLAALPMLALFHVIMLRKDKRCDARTPRAHIVLTYVFCAILTAILAVTGMPDIFLFEFDPQVNMVPFIDFSYNSHQYALNVLLFIPIGIFMPMLWSKYDKMRVVLSAGFIFSAFIEIIQLFNNRITDIDDLLMNTLGTALGYALFALLKKRFPNADTAAIGTSNHWRTEPYACFLFVCFSLFFIQPIISRLVLTPVFR